MLKELSKIFMKYVKWCFIKLHSRDGFIPNEVFY